MKKINLPISFIRLILATSLITSTVGLSASHIPETGGSTALLSSNVELPLLKSIAARLYR